MAPTSSGVDQQATRRPPIQPGATIYASRLKGGQGLTPFLKVTASSPGVWKLFVAHPRNLVGPLSQSDLIE
jgi:hypothetical protein